MRATPGKDDTNFMRSMRALGGLLAVVLLLASCIKVDGTIVINNDGSGSVDFSSAVDVEAFGSALGSLGMSEEDLGGGSICDEFGQDASGQFPDGAKVTLFEEDGFCGQRAEFDLDPSDDHSATVTDLFSQDARLYKQGDNWFFESDFDADEITSDTQGVPEDIVDDLFENASFRITIDLPGRAVSGENNADFVGDNGKFTWDIDLFDPPTRLFAQTEPGSGGGDGLSDPGAGGSSDGGGLNPLFIILALLLLGGAGFFLWKRSQDSTGSGDAGLSGTFDTPLATQAGSAEPFAASTPPIDAARETVIMSAGDVEQSVRGAATQSPAALEPVFDETLNAWIVDDPTRGRLRHDPATDTWNPI